MPERLVKGRVQRRKVEPKNISLYEQDHAAIAHIRKVRDVDSDAAAVRWALRYVSALLKQQEGIAA